VRLTGREMGGVNGSWVEKEGASCQRLGGCWSSSAGESSLGFFAGGVLSSVGLVGLKDSSSKTRAVSIQRLPRRSPAAPARISARSSVLTISSTAVSPDSSAVGRPVCGNRYKTANLRMAASVYSWRQQTGRSLKRYA